MIARSVLINSQDRLYQLAGVGRWICGFGRSAGEPWQRVFGVCFQYYAFVMLVLVFSKQKQFVLSSARILGVCVQVSKQQLLNSIWSILKQCVYFTTCLEAYSGGWCPAQFLQDAIYWYIIYDTWYYTRLQRLWIQKGLISPPVQGSKDLLIQHLQIFSCRWFCMSGLKEEPALYDSLFLPLFFPTFSPGRDGGGYSQVWTLSDPGGLSEVMTFLMCSSRPVHFRWAFLVGVAKSQVALAPSKFVGCLGSISEVASNWPRQECLVDCLSLIRTGHSVGVWCFCCCDGDVWRKQVGLRMG